MERMKTMYTKRAGQTSALSLQLITVALVAVDRRPSCGSPLAHARAARSSAQVEGNSTSWPGWEGVAHRKRDRECDPKQQQHPPLGSYFAVAFVTRFLHGGKKACQVPMDMSDTNDQHEPAQHSTARHTEQGDSHIISDERRAHLCFTLTPASEGFFTC